MEEQEIYNWIEGCSRNERPAQESLYKYFYADMFRTCERYAEQPHEALTILNDAFLKVFRNISQFKKESGSFKPWLKTIIINTAIDFTRRSKREIRLIHIDHVTENGQEDFVLRHNWKHEEILQHFKLLPSVTRLVINLFAFDGYTHKDIADELNISESTSRWHLSEARRRLRLSMQLKLNKMAKHE